MRKWIAAGVAVAGLAIFGGVAIAQQDGGQDPAQQPGTQQQEQTRPDGRDGDCQWKHRGGGQQQSSPETEV